MGGGRWRRCAGEERQYSFCSRLGTAGLCSQRHLKSLLLLFCLPVRLAGLTKNPLICGRLFEDNKMSEENSNNKKMRTKEQVFFKYIFFFLWRNIFVHQEHILVYYTYGIEIFFQAKYCLLCNVNIFFTTPFQKCQ